MSESNTEWYFQTRGGLEKGPFGTDDIIRSLVDGSISAKTLLRSNSSDEGSATWKVAAEHSELAGRLSVGSPTPVASPGMAEAVKTSTSCSVCGGALATSPKKTLLGFRKFSCQRCPNVELFPLTTTYFIIYCLVLCWATVSVVSAAQGGADAVAHQLGRVSIFALLAAFALVKNSQMRRPS